MTDYIAAIEAAPTCWTLSAALDRGETTYRGYLWFSDPQNSNWEPLYRGKAVEALLAELREAREERDAEQARADMHADLGRRTAEALGIPLEQGRAHMPEVAARLRAENEALRTALHKIHEIRNDIIRTQKLGWSAHVYPLVAALSEVGFEYEDPASKCPHQADPRGCYRVRCQLGRQCVEAAEKAGKEKT